MLAQNMSVLGKEQWMTGDKLLQRVIAAVQVVTSAFIDISHAVLQAVVHLAACHCLAHEENVGGTPTNTSRRIVW